MKQDNSISAFSLYTFSNSELQLHHVHSLSTASQALREGAAKLRKEGYGVKNGADEKSMVDNVANQKRGLSVMKIPLPNERASDQSYYNDPECSSEFDPPRKKIKQEEV